MTFTTSCHWVVGNPNPTQELRHLWGLEGYLPPIHFIDAIDIDTLMARDFV